jgi:hypothetical protein
MMLFGSVKVFPVQFPAPTFSRLLETYGDSSPLGLLFAFMGTSRGYSLFTGIVEMVAGFLLILPRVTTLGALMAAAALTNVFVINMAYDVPVKLYSLHVLCMAIVLIAPELSRIGKFILNLPVPPAVNTPLFAKPSRNQKLIAFQLVFGLSFAWNSLYQAHRVDRHDETRPLLYGVWTVDEVALNGTVHPPLPDDSRRWQRVVFEDPTSVGIQLMDGQMQRFEVEFGEGGKKMRLKESGDLVWMDEFTVEHPSAAVIVLEGHLRERSAHMKLQRTQSDFLLIKRGFHWINEFPFNR